MAILVMKDYRVRIGAVTNAILGYAGENNTRTLRIKTTDDISDFATIDLIIDTLDCGAMTVTEVSNYNLLSMVITGEMLGDAGQKTCQLVMMSEDQTAVLKSSQFDMWVRESNSIGSVVSGSQTAVAISSYIAEQVASYLTTDTTLTQSGVPADAEATGTGIDGATAIAEAASAAAAAVATDLTLTNAEITALTALLN